MGGEDLQSEYLNVFVRPYIQHTKLLDPRDKKGKPQNSHCKNFYSIRESKSSRCVKFAIRKIKSVVTAPALTSFTQLPLRDAK